MIPSLERDQHHSPVLAWLESCHPSLTRSVFVCCAKRIFREKRSDAHGFQTGRVDRTSFRSVILSLRVGCFAEHRTA